MFSTCEDTTEMMRLSLSEPETSQEKPVEDAGGTE